MADEKRISITKLLLTGILRPELVLYSPATAASKLGVAEGHVFRLVNAGHLERVVITDERGVEIGRGITQDSVMAYRKAEGRRRQKPLPLTGH